MHCLGWVIASIPSLSNSVPTLVIGKVRWSIWTLSDVVSDYLRYSRGVFPVREYLDNSSYKSCLTESIELRDKISNMFRLTTAVHYALLLTLSRSITFGKVGGDSQLLVCHCNDVSIIVIDKYWWASYVGAW